MRRLLVVVIVAAFVVAILAPAAYAGKGNPSGTGLPSQSCQTTRKQATSYWEVSL